jgi:hypothetical protein
VTRRCNIAGAFAVPLNYSSEGSYFFPHTLHFNWSALYALPENFRGFHRAFYYGASRAFYLSSSIKTTPFTAAVTVIQLFSEGV